MGAGIRSKRIIFQESREKGAGHLLGAISRMDFIYNLKTTNQNKKMMPPTITMTFNADSKLVMVVPPPMPVRMAAYSAIPAFISSPVLLVRDPAQCFTYR